MSGDCDAIVKRFWLHQQNVNRVSESGERCENIVVSSSFMDPLCRVRNKIFYVVTWRTVYALTRVLFWCLFPSLLRNTGIDTKITHPWAQNSSALEYIHNSILQSDWYSSAHWLVGKVKCKHISVNIKDNDTESSKPSSSLSVWKVPSVMA